MSVVELRSLGKAYGAVEVIHGIDLTIPHGELIALVGPSGCGKSTVLRMIAGLETITSGEVLIDGKVVNHKRPRDRNVAMVFQNYALYPHMSVRDNIALNMKIARRPKAEISDRVERAAALLDITALLDRKPGQLSGGQRQRVAMGRAIVRDPSAFLFDEPLSNLDAKLRVQMRSEIKALHQKVGTTSIFVTHDQIEAMTLANRVVVMQTGQIEQIGDPLELYARPVNLFVASFIGSPSMNLLKGHITESNGNFHAQLQAGPSVGLPPLKADARDVVVGIRPEHITIEDHGGICEGRIESVEPTGAQTFLKVVIGDSTLTVVADGARPFQQNEILKLSFPRANIHVFQAKGGERLNADRAFHPG